MDVETIDRRGTRVLIVLAFALSGMTSLMYEVVWTRPLQILFGSTIYAVSTILATFLFGFALGSYLFRNIADKSKNPLYIFAGLELGIGLYGIFIIGMFKILSSVTLSSHLFELVLTSIIIVIPATLFGATWPVVNKAYSSLDQLGKSTGLLYSYNSIGSSFGSTAAGFLLMPILGIIKTSFLVGTLNIVVAIIIFIIGGKKKSEN